MHVAIGIVPHSLAWRRCWQVQGRAELAWAAIWIAEPEEVVVVVEAATWQSVPARDGGGDAFAEAVGMFGDVGVPLEEVPLGHCFSCSSMEELFDWRVGSWVD